MYESSNSHKMSINKYGLGRVWPHKCRIAADEPLRSNLKSLFFITITYMMSLCFAGLIVFPRGPLGGQVGTSGVTGYFQRSTVTRPLRPLLDRYDRYTTSEHIMFLCTWCLPSFPSGPDASRASGNQSVAGSCCYLINI